MKGTVWLTIFLFVAISVSDVVEGSLKNSRLKKKFKQAVENNTCHEQFINQILNYIEDSASPNASWWPDINQEQEMEFLEVINSQMSIFENRVYMEAYRFTVQCEQCTLNKNGYPCCLRERANWVARILQGRNDMFRPICKKAMEFRVAPENCAAETRNHDFTEQVAAMMRCEAQCKQSNNQAICVRSSSTKTVTTPSPDNQPKPDSGTPAGDAPPNPAP